MRILVVDDDASIRKLLRDVLGMHGHAVIEADTLREGAAILEARMVELAVIDGQVPKDRQSRTAEAFGPALCQQARAMGVRTILMSAEDELIDGELRAGHAALLKPFSLQAILTAVAPPAGGSPAAALQTVGSRADG